MDLWTPVKYILGFIVGLFVLYAAIRVITYAGFMSYFQAKLFYLGIKPKGESDDGRKI